MQAKTKNLKSLIHKRKSNKVISIVRKTVFLLDGIIVNRYQSAGFTTWNSHDSLSTTKKYSSQELT